MKAYLKSLAAIAMLAIATPSMAVTILHGSTIDVTTNMLSTGYDTGLSLNQNDSFSVIFGVDGFSILDGSSFNETYQYDPILDSLYLQGQIIPVGSNGEQLPGAGSMFLIDSSRQYTVDVSGNLFLFGEFTTKEVSAPATLALLLIGIVGMFASRRRAFQ